MTVGEENAYIFTVNDTDNFNVAIDLGVLDEGTLLDDGDGMYTFLWRPEMFPNITGVSFIATDSSGASSLHRPLVQLCACFNGGECTTQGVPSLGLLVQTLTCVCDEGEIV